MKTRPFVVLLVAAALAGCGNHAVRVNTPAPPPISTGLTISISLSETVAEIIAGTMIIGLIIVGNSVPLDAPAPMKADRTVNEQDCTRPIVDLTANLNCK